jgi:hypothetical protein
MENSMIDIALTLDKLVPAAQYGGSLVLNIKESYDALRWEDSRSKPTWEQIENEWVILSVELKKQDCKDKAKQLLANSDWSTLPDVQTQLLNYQDFVIYRSQLRNLVINPTEDPVFPIEPNPIWNN